MKSNSTEHIQHIKVFFIAFLVLSALLSGFISNFLLAFIPSAGTLLTDVLCFIIIILYILEKGLGGKILKIEIIVMGFALLFGLLIILKSLIDYNTLTERVLGTRNFFLYFLAGISLVSQKKRYTHVTINLIYKASALICVFAVSQYIFRNTYPKTLLSLPQDADAFFFSGTDIFRVNGLIGNTIIFTGLALWASAVSVSRFIYKRAFVDSLVVIVSASAVFLTYSRAAWVFAIIQAIFIYFMINRKTLNGIIRFILMLISIILCTDYYYVNNSNDFVFKRLQSTESTTKGSTEVHGEQLKDSWTAIQKHPIFGVGTGSQGTSAQSKHVIITDGWMPQVALELGLPIGFYLLIFIVYINNLAYKLYQRTANREVASFSLSFISLTSYYFFTGIINSAFVGKTTYLLYWICAGIIISTYISLTNTGDNTKYDF